MIEKWSIKNKKDYAARHGNSRALESIKRPGYELVVKDMTLKRKYAHEWRESWEKVDAIRDVMLQFPRYEWFWWLDLVSHVSISVSNRSTRILWNHLNLWKPRSFRVSTKLPIVTSLNLTILSTSRKLSISIYRSLWISSYRKTAVGSTLGAFSFARVSSPVV